MHWSRIMALVIVVLGTGLPAWSQRDPEILVRADTERFGWRQAPEPSPEEEARRKVFALSAGESVRAWDAAAEPLDVGLLRRSVLRALTAQGFREAQPGEEPGVLILFHYGIGYLKNPYLTFENGVSHVVRGPPGTPTQVTRYGPDLRRMVPFRERRLQEADKEKLFIIVTAYDFAAAAQQKRRQLWTTTINVNARGNDLAQLFDRMVVAAAPFFGQKVEEEVEARVPRGHVEIGESEMVEQVGD